MQLGWAWILSNMKTLLETGEPMLQGYQHTEEIAMKRNRPEKDCPRWRRMPGTGCTSFRRYGKMRVGILHATSVTLRLLPCQR
jgi:hypothetical protein